LKQVEPAGSRWCIVLADDPDPAPVQYCRLGEGPTVLQRALHRAAAITSKSHVLMTALEEERELWEPSVWFLRAQQRFVCENRHASPISAAAAILSVAARSTSDVIAILPARCYVAHESILRRALGHALAELPGTPEGAVTLGMLDLEESVDEDYLIVSRVRAERRLRADRFVRRPLPWVARHLRRHGALVASGILIGYAGVFAAHISRYWPGLSKRLTEIIAAATATGEEFLIPSAMNGSKRCIAPRSLRWRPPALRQRVLEVCHSGWSGLKSLQSVARMTRSLANRADAQTVGSAALGPVSCPNRSSSSPRPWMSGHPFDRR
jgi:mannose-1-phosphate guanylyltransferase